MTTAAERLVALSGAGSASAAARLRAIGLVGATAGALLVAYSQLPTGSAAQHLLAERVRSQSTSDGGSGGGAHRFTIRRTVKPTETPAPRAHDRILRALSIIVMTGALDDLPIE